MKVIGTCNFNLDAVSDLLVCENVNEQYGQFIVKALNQSSGENGPRFYKLVPDDHVLYTWEP